MDSLGKHATISDTANLKVHSLQTFAAIYFHMQNFVIQFAMAT